MRRFTSNATFVAAVTLLLAACAPKPPECSDPKVAEVIREMTVENSKALLPRTTGDLRFFQDDPRQIIDGYWRALRPELTQVTADGYNRDARKYTCNAKLTLKTASGQAFSREIKYSTQATQDKDGAFVVQVAGFDEFVMAVTMDLGPYYSRRRVGGAWRGTYSCAGLEGATSGPQGPYSMNVELRVDENTNATLERTTRGGGFEKLTGTLGSELAMRGEGQNSPDDKWQTWFKGELKGEKLTASGASTFEGRVLRECKLDLTHSEK